MRTGLAHCSITSVCPSGDTMNDSGVLGRIGASVVPGPCRRRKATHRRGYRITVNSRIHRNSDRGVDDLIEVALRRLGTQAVMVEAGASRRRHPWRQRLWQWR